MEPISKIEKIVKFDNKLDLVKCLIYLKLSEKKIQLSDNELNILTLFSKTEDKEVVINISLDNKYIKCKQSGENFVSKLTNMGLLSKQGIGRRRIEDEFLPEIKTEIIAATYKIHNIDVTN